MNEPIYLDHNATTPLSPGVIDAMTEAMHAGYANPASQHEAGRRARRVVESARERIIALLGGETTGRLPDRLVFTSGGTEANNLALCGLADATMAKRIVLSPIEHPSVAAVADDMARQGWQIDYLPVDREGVVDAAALEGFLQQPASLVSVMLGNNETGAVQPISILAGEAATAGVAMHTDAVQAVGKVDVEFRRLGVTALSFTAHKFHGPLGIGGLLVRGNAELRPQLIGGFQQQGLRPGTESVALIVGLRTALEEWDAERQQRAARIASLRDRLEQTVRTNCPSTIVLSEGAERLPHTSNIAFVGLDRQALFLALDTAGVACSTGSACASGSSEPSPALVAMGLDQDQIQGSLRFSLGADTTSAEVDESARRISLICKRLQQAS